MTITEELFELSSRDSSGSVWKGARREIITGKENGTTSYQLLPEQSGALIVSNSLTGALYTLPTPVVGMWFEFFTKLASTSNEVKVVTKTIASEFIVGTLTAFEAFAQINDSGTSYPSLVGTSNVSINQNGTDTGGLPGDNFILTAVSSVLWVVSAGM
ncbi:hypothetical protein LCGC14_3110870, partial [marine sediment metagenome]